MSCSNAKCREGRVSVEEGAATAPCPECNNPFKTREERITMVSTDTYGFYEGKLYRLFQGVTNNAIVVDAEWHPVKNIGQIPPTARICDE